MSGGIRGTRSRILVMVAVDSIGVVTSMFGFDDGAFEIRGDDGVDGRHQLSLPGKCIVIVLEKVASGGVKGGVGIRVNEQTGERLLAVVSVSGRRCGLEETVDA